MDKELNPGYAGGIAKRREVIRLGWQLKGAPMRKKDLRLNSVAGIAEGRKLRDKVSSLMKEAKADPADAMVLCVFARPDLSEAKSAEMSITNGPADLALATKYVNELPIGFLVFVWDRQDPARSIFGHARPLIVEDPRALDLTEQALARATKRIENILAGAGMIPDKRN
jgi:hypothetical protein